MTTRKQYQCLQCGAVGYSVRCSVCGGEAEPVDDDDPGDYTIFSHAQLGHLQCIRCRETHGRECQCRLAPTGFGGL